MSRSFVVRKSACSARASNREAMADSVSADTSKSGVFKVMDSIASTSITLAIVSTCAADVMTECSASSRRLPPVSVLKYSLTTPHSMKQ